MFVLGSIYRRRDLHRLYGGQQQGGISTPSEQNYIMLFSSETGEQYGYRDGWSDSGLFLYTGEGQRGDMSFIRGNLAIRDHASHGKDLHVFEYIEPGYVRYVGQMIYTGYHDSNAPDIGGNTRRVIVFELAPLNAFDNPLALSDEDQGEELWRQSLSVLREHATESSGIERTPEERQTMVRYRSNAIRVYVLKRAQGICEGCGDKAPFNSITGHPYLEPHHVRRLSDGGPDDPNFVIALCPNCHRRAHYSDDYEYYNKQLTEMVKSIEENLVL
ncbi:HNH endonuclease [Candidatus Latescibacterota bacterium]